MSVGTGGHVYDEMRNLRMHRTVVHRAQSRQRSARCLVRAALYTMHALNVQYLRDAEL
jgi:hypothetical protein